RLAGLGGGHVGDRLGVGDPAGHDADPFPDPLVVGVHHAGQVVVGEHAAGLVVAHGDDPGTAGGRVHDAQDRPPMRASGWPGATGSSAWASHSVRTPASCAATSLSPWRLTTRPMTWPALTSAPSARPSTGEKEPATGATTTVNWGAGSWPGATPWRATASRAAGRA